MDEKLSRFVDHSLDKGLDHATIRQMLLSAGWKEKEIAEAFCACDLNCRFRSRRGANWYMLPADARREHRVRLEMLSYTC